MKKILISFVLLSLLLPVIGLAVSTPNNCCQLSNDIEWNSGQVESGTIERIPGSTGNTDCDALPCVCSTDDPCLLQNEDAITGLTNSTGGTTGTCNNGVAPYYKIEEWGIICLLNVISVVVNWIFALLIAMVAIMVIWGGINIATAGSDTEKVNKGRTYITYAVIGLAVALLSRAIPSVVQSLIS